MPSDSELVQLLAAEFPGLPVKPEWRSEIGRGRYSPRVDIAVGPFAVDGIRLGAEFSRLVTAHRPFLLALHSSHETNVRELDGAEEVPGLSASSERNPNARCLLAVEIERSGSRKHMLGGAVNAAALGRLGVMVACSAKRLRALLTIRRYLLFLLSVGKSSFETANLLIVTDDQFCSALGRGRNPLTPPAAGPLSM